MIVFEIDEELDEAEKLEAFELVEVVDADNDMGNVCCTELAKCRRAVGEDDEDRPVFDAVMLAPVPVD